MSDDIISLGELVPAPVVAREFHVSRRTLGRWMADTRMAFPQPVELNKRLYFAREELERWKLGRVRRSVVDKAG